MSKVEKLEAEVERLKAQLRAVTESLDEWRRFAQSQRASSDAVARLMTRLDQVSMLEAAGWRLK